MKIFKAYKYRLYPTREQETFLSKHFGAVRWVYNYALSRKIEYYKKNKKTLSRFDIQKEVVALKKQEDTKWLKEVNAQSLQVALVNLDVAYTKFFREKRGFPRFKNRSSRQSVQFPQGNRVSFSDNKLYVMKFREGVKCKYHRAFDGVIKSVTILKTNSGKYYASILVEEEIKDIKQKELSITTAVGIDMGIKDYLVTSNGDKYPNPKFLEEAEKKLSREQRRLSKKVKGSNNWKRQKLIVARAYEKVANCRKDYLHKISRELINNPKYNTYCLENLNVEGMLKNRHLSKAISDCSWSTFKEYLGYKAKWVGKNILEIGTFEPSSKTCSVCGKINKNLTLADRVWVCECDAKHDRDINAAINIRDFAFDKQNLIGLGRPEFTPVEIKQ